MKRIMIFMLSFVMIFVSLFAFPVTVNAAENEKGGRGHIEVRDEALAWAGDYENECVTIYDERSGVNTSARGFSYDKATGTLKINNVSSEKTFYWISVSDIENLNIEIIGECEICRLETFNSKVNITGSGKLTMNPEVLDPFDNVVKHIFDNPICAENGSFHIGKDVTVDIQNGSEDANAIYITAPDGLKKDQIFSFAGTASVTPEIVFKEKEGGPYTEPEIFYENNKDFLVKHKFPATSLYFIGDEYSKCYIKSMYCRGYQNNSYISALTKKNGVWCEVKNSADELITFADYNFVQWNPSMGTEILPEGLVDSEGYVTAYLAQATDSYGYGYTKGGEKYLLESSDYYNDQVGAVSPEAPENVYSAQGGRYILWSYHKLTELDDMYLLEPVETITMTAAELEDDSQALAEKYMADKGYEPCVRLIDEPYYSSLIVKNQNITFKPGAVHKHSYTSKITKPATCTKAGEKTFTCSGCNDSYTESIKANGHKYDKGTVTKAPTSGSTGVKTYKCKTCGSKKTESVAKIAKTTLGSVSAKSKGFTVKWTKKTTATGYEVMYSTSKTFKSGNKTVAVTKNSTVSKSITNLKAKKTYYVKVRCYKTIDGKKYYGSWTSQKAVTTKK